MKLCFGLNKGGLCNRLEGYIFARAISDSHGHNIVIKDWQELDSIYLPRIIRGETDFMDRLTGKKIRSCMANDFSRLGARRTLIIQRHNALSPECIKGVYLNIANQIALRADLADEIKALLESVKNSPLVGIHMRCGDFKVVAGETFDVRTQNHPRVPSYWYHYIIRKILSICPETVFLLSTNASEDNLKEFAEYPIIRPQIPNTYQHSNSGHDSSVHPVVDLFALACCPIILGTPLSSFSHWAANVLGEASWNILPENGMTPTNPSASIFMKKMF